jgi:hypothetical protein
VGALALEVSTAAAVLVAAMGEVLAAVAIAEGYILRSRAQSSRATPFLLCSVALGHLAYDDNDASAVDWARDVLAGEDAVKAGGEN